ncbi:hypothetical protein QC764_308130 [Podospora pseudoanserina]|uniref:UmuC domain-containing protein n=1 Tax=Podospora pseudoanserina TaxID=2609844 RepID=A0ABR0IED0_9PEZI|nr:hypothetical protein QC764_308130 [Podospora pseudoanserina]
MDMDMDNLDSKRKAPRRKGDDRVILHFDLDCFYAQCIENANPHLKSVPLGIKQKSILATCNYVARKHGVKKLMGIQEAKRLCPDLVLADGEDLSPFRDVSKQIYSLLKSYSWNGRVERLGLDEAFLDVTDVVAYNLGLVNHHCLEESWFCLSREDPERGFAFDAREVKGCVWPPDFVSDRENEGTDSLRLRLLFGSHLAFYLRQQIEGLGYTSACGISTNKLLAKLAGDRNKPRNQTTLLSSHSPVPFLDPLPLRKIPGIGSKTITAMKSLLKTDDDDDDLTVHNARTNPAVSPFALERLLAGSGGGGEKGIGQKVWLLLHGIDGSEVKPARDVPRQIGIEDTYRGLTQLSQVRTGLVQITTSLLRRMHVDLLDDVDAVTPPISPVPTSVGKGRWLAQPKTLRLTTRPYHPPSEWDKFEYNHGRVSKSAVLPRFVFDLNIEPESIAERLVEGTLMPLFHSLNPDKSKLCIGLLNVCVTNMDRAKESSRGGDIMAAFQRQREVEEIRGVAFADEPPDGEEKAEDTSDDTEVEWVEEEDEQDGVRCRLCGCVIPVFAVEAHGRWHELDEGWVEPQGG